MLQKIVEFCHQVLFQVPLPLLKSRVTFTSRLRVCTASLIILLAACSPITPAFQSKYISQALPRVYQPPNNIRPAKAITTHWTFNYFPATDADQIGAQNADYADEQWPVIALPHTWSTFETTGEVHPFIKNAAETDDPYWWHGWGWYRKHLIIGKELQGKKIFVEFDGVQKYSKIYLNGTLLGDHKGGFTSFYFDLTDYIKFGEANVLAVAVSNRREDKFNIPPMNAGNWNLYGGIYRDVRLVIKDAVHIPFQGSTAHEGGTFVTTPQVSADNATARIQTWVKNENAVPQEITLKTILTDSLNQIIQILENKQQLAAHAEYKFDQTSQPILKPQLWSVEQPYVYQVYSEVYVGDALVDTYQSPLGFRYFKWNYAEKRLYLNGKQMHLHGTNRHQEYPWLGDAIPKWLHAQDLHDIRYNLNHNFLRTCHYTQDKEVYNWADRHGLLIAEEVPNIKSRDFSEEVQEQQVKEMIRRDRNHPSILFWSMGNETNDAADSRWAHQEDTTRIIHARHVNGNSAGDFAPHTDEQMDMENLLRCTIRGWYNQDVKNLEPENGQHTGHEEFQHQMARKEGGSQRGRLDMGNGVMWIYADHGADREYVNSPLKHQNPKGWVDAYRMPKYLYYLWQANYAIQPMAFIHPHFWRQQYVGQQKDIVIDSNCDEVELSVNGKSYGSLKPNPENFHTVTFLNIPIAAGRIKIIGRKAGQMVENEVIMAETPARVVLQASHPKIMATPSEVFTVKADLVDKNGVHVYGATHTLTWEVTGPGKLVGPAVYTSDIDKQGQMEGTMYIDAPVTNVIRATGKTGIITVKVKAAGLITGTVAISVEALPEHTLTGIAEPVLPEINRRPVKTNTAPAKMPLKVPTVIRTSAEDLHWQETSITAYAARIKEILQKRHPATAFNTISFKQLINLFAGQLYHNQGELVADDYNFNVALYNQAHYLLNALHQTPLPTIYKEALSNYYAQKIIREGANIDLDKEMNNWRHLPAKESKVVLLPSKKKARIPGVRFTQISDLKEVVKVIYPEYGQLSERRKVDFLQAIYQINPFSINRKASVNSLNSYILVPDQPVLLPAFQYMNSIIK